MKAQITVLENLFEFGRLVFIYYPCIKSELTDTKLKIDCSWFDKGFSEKPEATTGKPCFGFNVGITVFLSAL